MHVIEVTHLSLQFRQTMLFNLFVVQVLSKSSSEPRSRPENDATHEASFSRELAGVLTDMNWLS